jgi:DNA-directed RNA polymerase specialized sigma24 family protein
MNFEEIFTAVTPKLRQLAWRYRSLCAGLDEDDLLNEMLAFLAGEWRRGALEDKTTSYMVQSCYFHLRNYLRTAGDSRRCVSLDASLQDTGGDDERSMSLADVIGDGASSMQTCIEGKALYETIMNNGFKKIEKEIVRCLVDGLTVREIGERLHISHAMVVKHKKNIAGRVTKHYARLLV